MARSTGLAGLAVTALVAAVVAAGVTALMTESAPAPGTPGAGSPSADGSDDDTVGTLFREVASLRREVDGMRDEGPRVHVLREDETLGADPRSLPTDLPQSREELDRVVDERVEEILNERLANGQNLSPTRKTATLEEAGIEIGLTDMQIDTAKRIYRDSEGEFLEIIFGTKEPQQIRELARNLKNNPDELNNFVQKAVTNMFSNAGTLLTIEKRRDKELGRFLEEEQISKLRRYNLKPQIIDNETEEVFGEIFD